MGQERADTTLCTVRSHRLTPSRRMTSNLLFQKSVLTAEQGMVVGAKGGSRKEAVPEEN